MNHAVSLSARALPLVIPEGGLKLSYGSPDAALKIPNSPTIDMGADDFLILVVAGITHGTEGKALFEKSDADFDFPKQVVLEWIRPDPAVGFRLTGEINETTATSTIATDAGMPRLYGLRRSNDMIEVRANGQIVSAQMALETPGSSTANMNDAFIGQFGPGDSTSVDTLHAVVVVRGALSPADVGKVESCLIDAFAL